MWRPAWWVKLNLSREGFCACWAWWRYLQPDWCCSVTGPLRGPTWIIPGCMPMPTGAIDPADRSNRYLQKMSVVTTCYNHYGCTNFPRRWPATWCIRVQGLPLKHASRSLWGVVFPSTSKSWLWENIPSSWTSCWGYRKSSRHSVQRGFPSQLQLWIPLFGGLSYTPWTIMCFALDHQPLGLQWTQTLQGVPDLDHSTVLLAAVPGRTTPNGGPFKTVLQGYGGPCLLTFHFPNNKIPYFIPFYPIFINILMECMTLWGLCVFLFFGCPIFCKSKDGKIQFPQDGLLCCFQDLDETFADEIQTCIVKWCAWNSDCSVAYCCVLNLANSQSALSRKLAGHLCPQIRA